jgi:hypothetical protein
MEGMSRYRSRDQRIASVTACADVAVIGAGIAVGQWLAQAESPLLGAAQRAAAATVVRSCEGLLRTLACPPTVEPPEIRRGRDVVDAGVTYLIARSVDRSRYRLAMESDSERD